MAKTKQDIDYQSLQQELDTILNKLQQDVDVDTAMALYRRGQEIVMQIEQHLTTAENTIVELQSNTNLT